MPRALSTTAILTALVATSVACGGAPRGPATAPVRFAISLDARAFAAGSTVEVSVWNQATLAARARSGACAISADAIGEHVACPPGVTYRRPPEPERFTFTVDELVHGFTIAALTITPGEQYEIAIGGRARDGCNLAGATARGIAAAGETTLADLAVVQTTMACGPAA